MRRQWHLKVEHQQMRSRCKDCGGSGPCSTCGGGGEGTQRQEYFCNRQAPRAAGGVGGRGGGRRQQRIPTHMPLM